jgi:hypothetical protein
VQKFKKIKTVKNIGLSRGWRSIRKEIEQELQELCRQGKLTPFRQPENYLCYFIHEETDIFIMNELIDEKNY